MNEGFMFDTYGAVLFFRVCRRYNITTYEDRLQLLRYLTKRYKAKYIRDVDSFVKGKNVIKLDPEDQGGHS